MKWVDLLLFSGAVYGASWIAAKSKLTEPVRKRIKPWPFLGPLSQCIVCTSAWVALALCFALHYGRLSIFSVAFRPGSPEDFLVLMAFSVAFVWILASHLGDAD